MLTDDHEFKEARKSFLDNLRKKIQFKLRVSTYSAFQETLSQLTTSKLEADKLVLPAQAELLKSLRNQSRLRLQCARWIASLTHNGTHILLRELMFAKQTPENTMREHIIRLEFKKEFENCIRYMFLQNFNYLRTVSSFKTSREKRLHIIWLNSPIIFERLDLKFRERIALSCWFGTPDAEELSQILSVLLDPSLNFLAQFSQEVRNSPLQKLKLLKAKKEARLEEIQEQTSFNSRVDSTYPQNRAEMVDLFIHYRASPNIEDEQGHTPLSYAIQNDGIKVVDLLIEHRADTDLVSPSLLLSPEATARPLVPVCELLKEKECYIDFPEGSRCQSPYMTLFIRYNIKLKERAIGSAQALSVFFSKGIAIIISGYLYVSRKLRILFQNEFAQESPTQIYSHPILVAPPLLASQSRVALPSIQEKENVQEHSLIPTTSNLSVSNRISL